MPRTLLNGLPHIIIAVQVEDIGHEIQRILIVLDLGVESREIKSIGEVVFVNFAEVLVTARGDELGMSAPCQLHMISSKQRGLCGMREGQGPLPSLANSLCSHYPIR